MSDTLPIGLKFKAQQFLQHFGFSHLRWDGVEKEGCEVTAFSVSDEPFGVRAFDPGSPIRQALENLEAEFSEAELKECDIRI